MRAEGLGHLCDHRKVAPGLLPLGCKSAPSRPDAWMIRRGHKDAGIGWMRKHGAKEDPLDTQHDTWITLVEVKMCPNVPRVQASVHPRAAVPLPRQRRRQLGMGEELAVVAGTQQLGGTLHACWRCLE